MGRPRIEMTEKDLRSAELAAGYGLTNAQIATLLGFSEEHLHDLKVGDEAVFTALERGRIKAQQTVGKALFLRAKDGDVAAIRWWEMTRAGRSAAKTVENTGTENVAVTVSVAPDWRALIGEPPA